MPTRDYHEALWAALPEDLSPPDFERRRRFLLEHLQAGERVLDVGCAEGDFAAELMRHGARLTAIDVAEEPLRRARLRHPELTLTLALVDGEGAWPLEDASFDLVWAGEVIEHLAHTAAWLSEVRRVLHSGGRLLLSTPDHGPLTMLATAIFPRAFAARFHPLSEDLRHYNRHTLSRLLESFGFEGVQIASHGGLPGARRLLLASAIRARF